MKFSLLFSFLFALLVIPASAELTVAPIFGDQMVLQRDAKLPVWGTAKPNAKIVVAIAENQSTGKADASGVWKVVLDPLTESSKPLQMIVSSGTDSVDFIDVLVGEVWLCSGQSNMAWRLEKCVNGPAEAEAATNALIRVNRVAGWQPCVGDDAALTSGVAFYFAQKLHAETGIPVGLIQRAVGGTPAEFWTPLEKLNRVPFAKMNIEKFKEGTEARDKWMAYLRENSLWKKKAKADGKKAAGVQPTKPGSNEDDVLFSIYRSPGSLWERQLEPVVPYAISGALWYQGERNTKAGLDGAKAYREILGNLITSWREEWNQGDFPFLVVQLPTYAGGSEGWAVVQEAQAAATTDVPAAAYVDIRDLPDDGLHPKDKKPVGNRLAELAIDQFLPK